MATAWKEGELLYQLYYERTWRTVHRYKSWTPSITVDDCIQVEKQVRKEIPEWWTKANASRVVARCLEDLHTINVAKENT